MNRGGKRYTVDWPDRPAPKPGDLFNRLTPTSQSAGYYRVTAVVVVKHKKPLRSGYVARYRVHADFIGEEPPSGGEVDWTMSSYKPQPRQPRPDRFSPLL